MNIPTGAIQAGDVIPITHRQIAALLFVETPHDPTDAAVEIRVGLIDGRAFSFTAYTPAALTRLMRDHGQASLVDAGMIVVRELSADAVLDALDKMLALDIARFGISI